MARDSTLSFANKISIGTLASILPAFYYVVGLEARVTAAEKEAARMEAYQTEVVARLEAIADQQTDISIDVGGIKARLDALIEWSDMKRKRSNPRP